MARYSISQAAKLLHISRDTLRRWEDEGKIAPVPRLKRTEITEDHIRGEYEEMLQAMHDAEESEAA